MHHVATGEVCGHGGIEDDVQRLELCQQRFPLLAALRVDQVPLPCHLRESVLLVGVVVPRRPRLYVVPVVEGLEDSIEMGHRAEAQPRGVERVHLRHALLAEVRGRTEAQLPRLVDESRHDFGRLMR